MLCSLSCESLTVTRCFNSPGFTTYWLGSVLGKSLLTLVRDVGPLGSVFIFGAWKILVFVFEVLSTTMGKKASRYNDGSVFSFCAIYTGKEEGRILIPCMRCGIHTHLFSHITVNYLQELSMLSSYF